MVKKQGTLVAEINNIFEIRKLIMCILYGSGIIQKTDVYNEKY